MKKIKNICYRFVKEHESDGESKSYCFYALKGKFIQEELKQKIMGGGYEN